MDDESLNFLKALKHVNPEKLTQLSKRFVTPLPSQSQSIGPSFPATQEFFKDFILHAFNPIFYTHLENYFVHEIMELNDTQFANSEIEDSGTFFIIFNDLITYILFKIFRDIIFLFF